MGIEKGAFVSTHNTTCSSITRTPHTDTDDLDEQENQENPALIDVSSRALFLLIVPLLCLAGIFWKLGLFDLSNSILEGCFRTFVQLHLLGWLLLPIFRYQTNPLPVYCYALFMIVLASYEATSRTKYTHDDQFYVIVLSLILNVGWVLMIAFCVILKPQPIWNPRYVLPILGMLLGNSISGISTALDTITTSLVERQSEVDLYLSFGASQYEAVSNIVAHAIQKGSTPILNMMCVVGIVSIPGMMTGQILGGSSPIVAARYQAMIIFLIALSTLSTILFSSGLTIVSLFCSHQILRPERLVKNRKRSLARLVIWIWGYAFGDVDVNDPASMGPKRMATGNENGDVTHSFLPDERGTIHRQSSTSTDFQIRPLKKGEYVGSDGNVLIPLMHASGLSRYFDIRNEDIDADSRNALGTSTGNNHRRVLFQDLSLSVNKGDMFLVSGPSGTGKSQLLRLLAGLSPVQGGSIYLRGKNWNDEYVGSQAVAWRKQIRYVTQTKVEIPGTPRQFIQKIQSFHSWKGDDVVSNNMMTQITHYVQQWGMVSACLDQEWSVLSGGEAQRVLIGIALASQPKVLLFDESTSALDQDSKLAVEASVKAFVEKFQGSVLWVSHDEQQAERMLYSESTGDLDSGKSCPDPMVSLT